jgi:hypothetical protein
VFVDDFCVLAQLFIHCISCLVLELFPNFDLVERFEYTFELVQAEVILGEVGASASCGPVETSSERVNEISDLVILFVSCVFLSLPEQGRVDLGDEGVKRTDDALSD